MIDRTELPSVPVETPHTNGVTSSHDPGEVSSAGEIRALRQELENVRMILTEIRDMAKRVPFLSKYFK